MKRFQYAKWLRRLWLRGSGLKESRQSRTVLAIESLEERTVPSILFSSTGSRTITDSGGPILQSMQVDLIFWGSGWNSGNGPTERTNVRSTMNNILTSTYFDGLAQYRGIGHGTLFREDLITTSSPGRTFQTASNGDLATMVGLNIFAGNLPIPNGRILYFVVPQPGSTPSDCNGCGGRHLASFVPFLNLVFPYGLVSNPNNVSVDSLSLIISHELVEAATNPEWNIPNQAAFHVPGSNGDEIGDGEPNNNNYAMRLNGNLVQAYLSQRDHAYIITNGSTNDFTVSLAGILSFQEFGGGNNSIDISRVNNGVFVTLNSSTAQFEPSSNALAFSIRGIQVNALLHDGITIVRTGADAPVTVNFGSGSASVFVGTGLFDLGNIQGSIRVNGGTGSDSLVLQDTAAPSSSNLTYTLTASSVTRSGMASINFSGQSNLSLSLGGSRGADMYNVSSTQPGSTTTITAGGGEATVNVEATTGALTVNLTGSNNSVNVAPISLNLDRIHGAIAVHGAGSSSLRVFDSSKSFSSAGPPGSYTVTNTSIQRSLTAAISYQSLSPITLNTGVDVAGRPLPVHVTGTAAGTTTAVVARGGFTVIDVQDSGHTLNGLRGDLHVNGAGVTQLGVIDSGTRFSGNVIFTYTVAGDSVQRAGTAAIRYSAVSILEVSTGVYLNNPPFPIVVNVTGTSAASTTVTTQVSALPNQIIVGDTAAHTLDGIRGALTVNGASFSQLTVDDHGTNANKSYTLGNNSVNRMGTPAVAITYNAMITLDFHAANGANTIEVTGTAGARATTIDAGSGGTGVNVRATSTPLAVTFHNFSNAAMVGSTAGSLDGIQGAVTLNGSLLTNTLVITDGGSGSARTYTVTSSTVAWGGSASITYNNFNGLTLNGGNHGNTVNVESTSANVNLGTVLDTGTGTNTINLSPTAHNLNNLAGLVNINGQGGTNTLNAFDQATTFSQSDLGDDLYQDHLTRYDTPTTARTLFTYGGMQAINISAGRGDPDTEAFGVISTPAGVPVTVTDAGVSMSHVQFIVRNNGQLNDIRGPLTLHGRTGGDDFISAIDDSQNPSPEIYTVTANTVTRMDMNGNPDMAPIVYDNQNELALVGSSGGNKFTVQSLLAGTALTLIGGSGSNTLIGSNAGNSWEVTGADTGVLSGPAYPNPVGFQQVGNLTAGSGGDHFLVDDQATLSGSLRGGGSDTLDYSPYSTSVLVDLQTGVATGVGGLVSGITTVLGGNGNGTQAYNLLIGNGGDTLIGGFGRSNILVAGGSASTLMGGDSNDLLIGGTTSYDNDPNDPGLLNWQQIAAYWAGTDGNTDDFATRVANLMSGNGVPRLVATGEDRTVTGNGGGNTMTGNGELALIYSDGNDNIAGFDPNLIVAPITP